MLTTVLGGTGEFVESSQLSGDKLADAVIEDINGDGYPDIVGVVGNAVKYFGPIVTEFPASFAV